MGNFAKIIKENINAIENSDKTLKDVYSIMFSHSSLIAYERLVAYEVEAVTYAAHDLEIRAFAAYLNYMYPGEKSEYIGIDLANTPNFLIAFWGVLMSGNKPYLINSFYPVELRVKLLKKLNVKLVIAETADYIDFTIINIDVFDKKCPQIADEFWQNEFALSSALTGLDAKICVFDGEAVVNQILNTQNIIKTNKWLISYYQNRAKVAMILPLFHIFGIMVSYFWYAFFGQTMVFIKDSSPDTIRGTINRHKVTHIFAPPILFHKLYRGIMNGISQESEKQKKKFKIGINFSFVLQNIFPSFGVAVSKRLFKEVLAASFGMSPRLMISGGAHIDSEVVKIINCIGYPLFNGYGTTETAITGANLALKIRERTNGSIGNPFQNVTYTIDADETLIVSGGTICKRIILLENEPLDSNPLDSGPLNSGENGIRCIKTNDLVKTINGRLFVVGRKSDLYIGDNGENISPDTIQNILNVKRANRFCVLEIDRMLSIVLEYNKIMPREIITDEIEHIKMTLEENPCGHYVNNIFVTYDPIAGQSAIKVSRPLLIKKIDEGEVLLNDYKKLYGGEKDGQEDETMSVIKQAFKKAAERNDEVQSNEDFFLDLGGDSLGYFSLICELENIFNIQFYPERNKSLRTPDKFYKYVKEML